MSLRSRLEALEQRLRPSPPPWEPPAWVERARQEIRERWQALIGAREPPASPDPEGETEALREIRATLKAGAAASRHNTGGME